mmetsp:Transcript_195/g.507  ORF Transcript_195/g.507 Transcript_195/m.507 type:complete len:212 (-) Transcript_195:1761-2396(-)
MRRCSSASAAACSVRSRSSKGDRSLCCSWSSSPEKVREGCPKSPMSGAMVSEEAASAPSSTATSALPPLSWAIFVRASAMYSSFSSKDTVTTRQPHFRRRRRLNVAEPVRGHSMLYSSPRTSSMTSTGLPLKFPSPISSRTFCRGMVMRCGPSTSMMSLSFSMTMSARMPASWQPSSEGGMPLAAWGMRCMRRRSERRWFCWLMLEPVTSS